MRNPEANTLHLHQRLFRGFTLIDVIRLLFKAFMPRISVRYGLLGRRIGFLLVAVAADKFFSTASTLRPTQSSG